MEENLEAIYLLEEAYISSRYLLREYEIGIVLRALRLSNRVLRCLNV